MKIKDYILMTVAVVMVIISYVIIRAMSTKQNNSSQVSSNNSTNQSSSGNSSSSSGSSNATSNTSGQYSKQDVAKHNTASDCWVILTINNKSTVYDVTQYVSNPSQHPGGDVIAPFCGQDITGPFLEGLEGGRVHSSRAESMLSEFAIGSLAV